MNINANINTRININTNTRARGLTARRPKQTHTICYSALVGGGRRAIWTTPCRRGGLRHPVC